MLPRKQQRVMYYLNYNRMTESERSTAGKFRQAAREINDKNKKENPYKIPIDSRVKVVMYLTGGFIILWAAQYVLDALAGAIRSFKNLKKSIRE